MAQESIAAINMILVFILDPPISFLDFLHR